MASVSTYLNFNNKTEEAFNFYKSIFGGEFTALQRFSGVPNLTGQEKMTDADKNGIMHIALPILGGHRLLGADAPESMGFKLVEGNTVYINLEPDSREEADRLFNALSAGGKIEMPMEDMFWGDYYGSCADKYGVHWMVNYSSKK
jgi:PhnB protein